MTFRHEYVLGTDPFCFVLPSFLLFVLKGLSKRTLLNWRTSFQQFLREGFRCPTLSHHVSSTTLIALLFRLMTLFLLLLPKGSFPQLRPCQYPGHRVTALRVPLVVLWELPLEAADQAGMSSPRSFPNCLLPSRPKQSASSCVTPRSCSVAPKHALPPNRTHQLLRP